MRRAFFVILVLLIGVIPLQTSGQVSVPAVDLQCHNAITQDSENLVNIIDILNSSEEDTTDNVTCILTNPNSYAERIQIQYTASGLLIEGPGTFDLGPNAQVSFNVTINSGPYMDEIHTRQLSITATVVEANGAPPPNIAESQVNGVMKIGNYKEYGCFTMAENLSIDEFKLKWNLVEMQIGYTNNSDAFEVANVSIKLDYENAPLHSENFALLTWMGCYDDVLFHRVIDNFVIQSGDIEMGNGQGGHAAKWYGYCNGDAQDSEGENYTSENCPFEHWSLPGEHENGLAHGPGTLAAAHAGLNTDGSQFYIVPSDSTTSHLDWNEGKDCSSSSCHTVYGSVIDGFHHIDSISEVPTSSSDKPTNNVTIISARLVGYISSDTDGDGVPDHNDAFPNDANETTDSDSDGVGDNSDAFPDNANETTDSDGDGVGDNSDVFPNDANETHDDDGDGVGNNSDEFPQDPTEQYDDDQDGVGNNADDFPNNALMSNWATVYATVGILLVLLIAAGVTISRMKKQEELPNVAADSDLQKLQNEIDELEKKKAELLGLQDPTAELFDD